MDGYQEEGLTYADLNPQTVMLSDGVRSRKTATGYVVEVMGSDEHWHAITGSDWDSDTKFNAGTIVLDRGGQWKALVANTNSRPVSGNTDWELVGGTPYVDVVFDPVDLMVGYNESTIFPVCDAPGTGMMVFPTKVISQVTEGIDWADQAYMTFFYGVFGASSTNTPFVDPIPDSLDGVRTDAPRTIEQDGFASSLLLEYNEPRGPEDSVVDSPLGLSVGNDVTGGGSIIGSRSLVLRIFYKIIPVSDPDTTLFFPISAIDQGTKTITINGDATGSSGSIQIVGNTGDPTNNGTYTIVSTTLRLDPGFEIVAIPNYLDNNPRIAGDHTDVFPGSTRQRVIILGSPSNDGVYVELSGAYVGGDDQTNIDLLAAGNVGGRNLVDGTVGGEIGFPVTDIVVTEDIPDSTADGWVKQ